MACKAPSGGSGVSQDGKTDYCRLVVRAMRRKRERGGRDLLTVIHCLTLPQTCPLSQRQHRISTINTQLDQDADIQQLQQILDKDFTDVSKDDSKSLSFKVAQTDPMKLSEFMMELEEDKQQAKQLLRELLTTFTSKRGEARPLSPVSYRRKDETQLYPDMVKQRLLDLARKPMPDLYKKSAGVLAADYADDPETVKMIKTIAASPTAVELLPDLCSLVFRNQRCMLFQHIMQELEPDSSETKVQAEQNGKEAFTDFLEKMTTFTDRPGWMVSFQLYRLVCASTILLEPVFSEKEKQKMGDKLFDTFITWAVMEREKRATELQQMRVKQSDEAAVDLIQGNLVEDYFGADDEDPDKDKDDKADEEEEDKDKEEEKDEETAEIDPEAEEWGCSVQ